MVAVTFGLCGQGSAAVADSAAAAVSAQAGSGGMAKVGEMIEKLKAENLVLQKELVAKKTAHARSLPDNVRLQRDMRNVAKQKEETAAKGCGAS